MRGTYLHEAFSYLSKRFRLDITNYLLRGCFIVTKLFCLFKLLTIVAGSFLDRPTLERKDSSYEITLCN